jgi:Cu/Ag efflux protein CusF
MRALLFSSAAVLLCTAAVAADVSGDITKVDNTANTITLKDGSVYTSPKNVDISKFKVGETVNMSYDKSGDKMVITSIKAAGRP